MYVYVYIKVLTVKFGFLKFVVGVRRGNESESPLVPFPFTGVLLWDRPLRPGFGDTSSDDVPPATPTLKSCWRRLTEITNSLPFLFCDMTSACKTITQRVWQLFIDLRRRSLLFSTSSSLGSYFLYLCPRSFCTSSSLGSLPHRLCLTIVNVVCLWKTLTSLSYSFPW